jgi:hypothetical protein
MIKSRLESFKNSGYVNPQSSYKSTQVNVNNTINNNIGIEIDIQFENIIKDINNNSYLTDDMKEEYTEITNQTKNILKSDDSRIQKWGKLKEILKTVSDKGLDFAVQILATIVTEMMKK